MSNPADDYVTDTSDVYESEFPEKSFVDPVYADLCHRYICFNLDTQENIGIHPLTDVKKMSEQSGQDFLIASFADVPNPHNQRFTGVSVGVITPHGVYEDVLEELQLVNILPEDYLPTRKTGIIINVSTMQVVTSHLYSKALHITEDTADLCREHFDWIDRDYLVSFTKSGHAEAC